MAIPVLWRTQKARYSLQGDVCPECTRAVFPPRRVCPYCGHEAKAAAAAKDSAGYEFVFVVSQGVDFHAAGDD